MDFFQFLALKLTDLFPKNQVHPLVHLMFTQGSPLRLVGSHATLIQGEQTDPEEDQLLGRV